MADTLQAVADKVSLFPGNSLGTTWLPNWMTGAPAKVGEGTNQVNWTDWLHDVSNNAWRIVNPGAAIMPTAMEIARDASKETTSFVQSMSDRATGAVTGIGETITGFFSGLRDTVKYIAWGLVAVAIVYVLVVLVLPVTAAAGRK